MSAFNIHLPSLSRGLVLAGVLAAVCSSAWADRTVTDQLGREVTIPDKVDRVVTLQHQTLNLLAQLDASDKVVGVLSSWEKNLGPGFVHLMPSVKNEPMPGDLTSVNIESLAKLKPQVVFVANYAPKEMIDQITKAGIPVIGISLRRVEGDKSALNPDLKKQEDAVYTDGLYDGIRLIADVVGRQKNAEELIAYVKQNRRKVEERLKDVRPEDRVRTYIANPNLVTYGSGKYTGVMLERAGAENVAAKTVKGYKPVSIEQVVGWNPSVIFVQNRYPSVVGEILSDPKWKVIDAVKSKRVYLMPEYAKAWGYSQPEALAIGELWLAKKLYPEHFKDIDMNKEAQTYYGKFYRTTYEPSPDEVRN